MMGPNGPWTMLGVYYISQVPEAKGVLQVPYYIRVLLLSLIHI